MDSVTNVKSVPVQERLKSLDQEIQKLILACKDAGYTPDKIREAARPLLQAAQRDHQKGYAGCGALWSVFVGVLIASQWIEPINWATSVVTKKFLVYHVLPYYDWTLWYDPCLARNPYYKAPDTELITEECEVCKDLKNLTIMTKVNSSHMAQLIYDMKPSVVGDAMEDWKSMQEPITLDDIIEMYRTNPHLTDPEKLCDVTVSKGIDVESGIITDLFKTLENEVSEGREGNFTAYWNACHRDSAKEMHKLYYTPYFLPGMCEPTRNRLLVFLGKKSSSTTNLVTFFRENISNSGLWIAQLQGVMQLSLSPRGVCAEICQHIHIFLAEGQILNIPDDRLYITSFRPHTETAVAIGTTYVYN